MTDRKIDMSNADWYDDGVYDCICPACGCDMIVRKFKFCPMCGGELDWPVSTTIDVNKDNWTPPYLPSDKEIVGLRFYECPECGYWISYFEKDTSRIVKKCPECCIPIIWKGLPE